MKGKKSGLDQVDSCEDKVMMFSTALCRVSVSMSEQSVSPDRSRACTPSHRLRTESCERYLRTVLCVVVPGLSWEVVESKEGTASDGGQGGEDPWTVSALGLGGSGLLEGMLD